MGDRVEAERPLPYDRPVIERARAALATAVPASTLLRSMLLAVVLTGVGLAWFVFVPADSSVSSDDGAYAFAVAARDEGSWSLPYWFAAQDPDGVYFPLVKAIRVDDRYYPSPRYPVHIEVLRLAKSVGGAIGMHAISVASAALAIAGAGALAREAGLRRWGAGAVALAASSPLVFNGFQLWAHASATAAVTLVLWAALRTRAASSFHWVAVSLGVVGAASAAAVRADGTLFVVAVAVVVGMWGLVRRSVSEVTFAGAVGLAALAVHRWSGSIIATGSTSSGGSGSDALGAFEVRSSGSLSGVAQAFVETFLLDVGESETPFVVGAIVFAVFAVLMIRRRDLVAARVGLLVSAVLLVARLVLTSDDLIHGLAGAWPLSLLVFAEPLARRTDAERVLVAVLVVAAIGVAATQYDAGSGVNWGGRFLAAGLPAMAVLVAGTLGRTLDGHAMRPTILAAVGALGAVSLLGSLVGDATMRRTHDRLLNTVEQVDPSIPIVTQANGLPRIGWRTYPERRWLLLRVEEDPENLREALVAAGVDRIAAFGVKSDVLAVLSASPVDPDRQDFDLSTVDVPR